MARTLTTTSSRLSARSCVVAILAACSALPALAQSPWLPSPGSNGLKLSYDAQKADEFYAGATRGNLPASLKQNTFRLDYSYGISDALALDVSAGHAKSDFIKVPGLAPNGGLSGTTDSRIGIRFRVLDDLADAPATLTLGAGAVFAGSYSTGALSAIGDGANAFEVSASLGKAVTANVNVYGTLGYRSRQSPVPKETYYQLGASFSPTPLVSVFINHEQVKSQDGLDIGGPGFSPARFPEVKEQYKLNGVGASFRFTRNVAATVQYGEKQGIRNTAQSKVTGFALSTSF